MTLVEADTTSTASTDTKMTSSGGDKDRLSSAGKQDRPGASVHPFFMPLSAKRAHTATMPAKSSSGTAAVAGTAGEGQPKRQKQKTAVWPALGKRGRKPKAQTQLNLGSSLTKPTRVQSFFATKAERSDTQAQAFTTGAADSDCGSSTRSEQPAFTSINSEADNRRLKRMAARAAGIPAPYPKEFSHTPAPQFTPFVSTVRNSSNSSRFGVDICTLAGSDKATAGDILGLAAAHDVVADDGPAVGGGCAQWRSYFASSHFTAQPLSAQDIHYSQTIKAAPVHVSLGMHLPKAPPHMHYAEPLLAMLRNNTQHTQAQNMQLLASRYQPRRAREVLDNKRAVSLLHSWIEGMRLKHTLPSSKTGANTPLAAAEPEGQSSHMRAMAKPNGRRTKRASGIQAAQRSTRQRRRVADDNSESCSDHTARGARDSDGGSTSSSDDFMPTRTASARRRRDKDDKAMKDVCAWAQSNGTVNSVRENLRAHSRRRGSGSESESETFSNIILLEGPSGSGKTAAVYACAEESGFQVHEIHPGQKRSGKDILAALEDLILSHTIASTSTLAPASNALNSRRRALEAGNGESECTCNQGDECDTGFESACSVHSHVSVGASSSGNNGAAGSHTPASTQSGSTINQLLVLIDQIDVLFEQDQRLWPALRQLALKSRRPIVLTCSDMSCIRWDAIRFHSVLPFRRPGEHSLVPYCFLLCLVEGALVSPADLARLCKEVNCDINRMLCSLEVVIRQVSARLSSPSTDSCSTPPVADVNTSLTADLRGSPPLHELDLGGTLAWLFSPLELGETPASRYNFWSELVTSAQPMGSENWFRLWPDPPPSPETPVEESSSPAINQNSYATHSWARAADEDKQHETSATAVAAEAAAAAAAAAAVVASLAFEAEVPISDHPCQMRPGRSPVLRVAVPAVISETKGKQECRHGSVVSSSLDPQSALEELDRIADALDALSLAGTSVYPTQAETECACEPLHSHLNPMADGCLGVNYIILDPDVLACRNDSLLPDSAGCAQATRTHIYDLVCSLAADRLAISGTELLVESLASMMAAQGASLPSLPPARATKSDEMLRGLHEALDFADVRRQRRPSLAVEETASYLSFMVVWDCVHQGKIEPPARESAALTGEDHQYRVGMRRTRTNTYRAHIKRVPAQMQAFLSSWHRLGGK
ncbi:hypothetical protein GQ54DRAFT_295215 [Martensiomyces pterosporus]|nr:hypothetical protein GQ54DRAFT_295215 [Martensiomyces pterosporus]